MSEPELKPCPFCGGRATFSEKAHGIFGVDCNTKNCQGNHSNDLTGYLTEVVAFEKWNSRPSPWRGMESLFSYYVELTALGWESPRKFEAYDEMDAVRQYIAEVTNEGGLNDLCLDGAQDSFLVQDGHSHDADLVEYKATTNVTYAVEKA